MKYQDRRYEQDALDEHRKRADEVGRDLVMFSGERGKKRVDEYHDGTGQRKYECAVPRPDSVDSEGGGIMERNWKLLRFHIQYEVHPLSDVKQQAQEKYLEDGSVRGELLHASERRRQAHTASFMKRVTPVRVALAVLSVMFVIEVSSAWSESQIIDEAVHMAAGVSYWHTGDFRMNPEHPPLIKLLATAPLALLNARSFTEHPLWKSWNEWEYADYFLYHNVFPVQTMLMLGRIPVMLLSVALGWWIFRASSALFGGWGGVVSVGMFALDPNMIAHSRYITTDLGFSAFALLSIYRLSILLQRPSTGNGIWFGTAFFAMAMSKFSSELLIVVMVLALVVVRLIHKNLPALQWRSIRRWLAIAIPAMVIAAWALYGFDTRRPSDDPRIHQLYSERQTFLAAHDPDTLPPLERFVVTRLGDRGQSIGLMLERVSDYKVPLYAFFRGAIAVVGHNIGGQGSYVLGHFGDRGWWYYFPLAIAVKTPLQTLIGIIGIALLGSVWWRRKAASTPRVADRLRLIPIPVLLYSVIPLLFVAFSTASRLNLGWRHMMPIYPFIYVLIGSLAFAWTRTFRPIHAIAAGALALNAVVVQVGAYPNELGYFNSLAGGTAGGPRYLLDSNLDWGQDLPKLAAYVRENRIAALPFAYYGRATVSAYIPNAVSLPSTDELSSGTPTPRGIVAISVGELIRSDDRYSWLYARTPFRIIGSSIYLYSI